MIRIITIQPTIANTTKQRLIVILFMEVNKCNTAKQMPQQTMRRVLFYSFGYTNDDDEVKNNII